MEITVVADYVFIYIKLHRLLKSSSLMRYEDIECESYKMSEEVVVPYFNGLNWHTSEMRNEENYMQPCSR